MSENQIQLVIHGHFYQPPRENPWLGYIERQPSAGNDHDWNSRIVRECYRPVTAARVLDDDGKIRSMVNLLDHMSFNFGPTLLGDMERRNPRVYRRILDADARSLDQRGGHGNALAQCYNHVIMPLASQEDRELQIEWGLADFEARFGRCAEGIWLPETAIHTETAEQLVGAGIRFVILSPDQAERVRPVGSEAWVEVGDGSIDTRRVYRWFADKNDPHRYLDIFFYHKEMSVGISFEHYLKDASRFAETLAGAAGDNEFDHRLLPIASDGEVYGHHEDFGDMCLAALFDWGAAKHHLRPTNFGEYLDLAPPTYEVEIKQGPEGEGTAWSCSHGVGRWIRDCGCKMDHGREWNQAWRGPIRDAFDTLRADLDPLVKREGDDLFRDRRKAALDYARLHVGGTAATWKQYWTAHAREGLPGDGSAEERAFELLRLLDDLQKIYTSCGWFFDDLAGIEPVQNLLYAAHALEIARTIDDGAARIAEKHFLAAMLKAKSNRSHEGTGRRVYRHRVESARVDRFAWLSGVVMAKLVGAPLDSMLLGDREVRFLQEEHSEPDAPRAIRVVGEVAGRWGVHRWRFVACALEGEKGEISAWVAEGERENCLDLEPREITALGGVEWNLSRLPVDFRRAIAAQICTDLESSEFPAHEHEVLKIDYLEEISHHSGTRIPAWAREWSHGHWTHEFSECMRRVILLAANGGDLADIEAEAKSIVAAGHPRKAALVDESLRRYLDEFVAGRIETADGIGALGALDAGRRNGVEPWDLDSLRTSFWEKIQTLAKPDEHWRALADHLGFSDAVWSARRGEDDRPATTTGR